MASSLISVKTFLQVGQGVYASARIIPFLFSNPPVIYTELLIFLTNQYLLLGSTCDSTGAGKGMLC